MKNLPSILLLSLGLLATTSTVTLAASSGGNGKPFQELNAIIDGNRALIDANKADITVLQSDVAGIGIELADLQGDLLDLEGRVTANEGDIADLQFRVGALEGDFVSLNADLAQLRVDHEADMVDIDAAIAAAMLRIVTLEMDLQNLVIELSLQLANIEGDVGDNAMAIDAMLLELTTTSAKALANMMAINALEGQVDGLLIRADQHEADIDDLQLQINNLDTRLSGLESGGPTSCAGSSLWQPVDCTAGSVWSSDRSFTAVELADANRVLWVGDQHAGGGVPVPNTCSLDGTGWVSTEIVTMEGCNTTWSHITLSGSFNCLNHVGDQVRRLTHNPEGCYDYTP